jgi:ATP/maltotriose-dependent transcriptional regulator MalT/DNA-binding SARP family transcriptional activator
MSARLPAKFLPPRPRQAIERPRLHRLLDAAAPARGIWLQAEAGAGKSTLAAAWAAERGLLRAWFRVDSTDLDLRSAFASLAELLASLSRKRLPAAITRAPPLGDEASLSRHSRWFFRAFHAHAGPLSLVFDDVHAAASPGLLALLHAALDEAPPDSLVVMTSRHPPQGLLLEAAARGELCLVEGEALAFTREEAQQLLAPRLAPPQADAVWQRCGGWAAGLTLVAAQAWPDPAEATEGSAERTLRRFFDERVLGLLSAAQRQTLAAASWLAEADAHSLAALGLPDSSIAQLDQACEQLGFVQRLRRGRACWRLHDLLKQALQASWEDMGTAEWRRGVLHAAARLHGEQGRVLAAVQLLQRAGLRGAALALWCNKAPALLRQGRAQELKLACSELGAEFGAPPDPAQALTLRGLVAWVGQDADAEAWFERAWAASDEPESEARQEAFATAASQAASPGASEPGLRATSPDAGPIASPQRLLTAAAALNAQFSGWRSYAGRGDWVQRFVAHWPARARLADAEQGLRADKAAILCFLSHRMAPTTAQEREALLARVLARLAQPDPGIDANVAVSAASSLIEWCNYSGERALLARLADLSPPWLAQPGLAGVTQASWWISYGWVTVRMVMGRSDLPEGEAAVEHGAQLALDSGAPDIAFYGLANLVAAAASRGQIALAEERLQRLQAVAAQRSGAAEQPTQQATVHVLAARLLTLRGDARTALLRIERALELAQASDFPLSETWVYRLGQVQVLTALEREEEAAALAQAQARLHEGMRSDCLLALAELAECVRSWRKGEPAPPRERIQQCLGLAARHDWTALGNHLPAQVARLAAAALARGIERPFVLRLLAQRRLGAPAPDLIDWPWPLRILALGGFSVQAEGHELDFGARPQKKPLDLLRLLVAHGPAAVPVAGVIDALWPEADGDRAKASFDMAVLRLRKLLGREDAVLLDDGRLGLNRELVWVDAWAWVAGQALPYAPLFGPQPPELAWAAPREALHAAFLRRCHQEGSAMEAQARWQDAKAHYEAALVHDGLDEALHRGLVRSHLALGERAAAQRALQRCAQQLMAGLGVRPSAATLALLDEGKAAAAGPGG